MNTEVRVVSADDWSTFRAVRLRALADSPDSFGVTLAEATGADEAAWRTRAEGPGPRVVAFEAGEAVAMGGLHTPPESDEAFVWGMWVAPESRGRGLATDMLRELLEPARVGSRTVVLHVSEGNTAARRLYESNGFVSTGEWEPLRDGSDVRIEKMKRV